MQDRQEVKVGGCIVVTEPRLEQILISLKDMRREATRLIEENMQKDINDGLSALPNKSSAARRKELKEVVQEKAAAIAVLHKEDLEIEWEVTFQGDWQRSKLSYEDVVRLPNGKDEWITSISVTMGRTYGSGIGASVRLGGGWSRYRVAEVRVNGPTGFTSRYRKELEDKILGMRPAYSSFVNNNGVWVGIFGVLATSIVYLLVANIVPNDDDRTVILLNSAFLLVALFSFTGAMIRRMVFPEFECVIGEGVAKHTRLIWIRRLLVSAAFTSIVIPMALKMLPGTT